MTADWCLGFREARMHWRDGPTLQQNLDALERTLAHYRSTYHRGGDRGRSDQARRVRMLHCRISSSSADSDLLFKLRDTLIPKLISGELRIADAERVLEKSP